MAQRYCIASLAIIVVSLANLEPEQALVIACAGDSITAGKHGYTKGMSGGTYPSWLDSMLPSNATVHNLGISGATATLTEKSYRATLQYKELVSLKFSAAIVTLGTNDAKLKNWEEEAYIREYVALLREVAASNPNGVILVGL